jgi:hypothetical protein
VSGTYLKPSELLIYYVLEPQFKARTILLLMKGLDNIVVARKATNTIDRIEDMCFIGI